MTLEEAFTALVSRDEVLCEVRKHGCDENEFLTEVGDRDEYLGEDVLGWLGY
ncbi:hypothetical protein [Luteibacter sp. 22Crub2.1]|uniref:hypothetical protein n=1 Tax=Luteibacter sp. 22Crub2.1 TaxID=1283288 RepID=UPI0009D562E6|nr:hypothetical protein [Luteibacter sp. 22Crub2.1]SKB50916.1 hypothetical protein SAMN05660880_01385 [Luteibacter sp. 22Crub2.1]